MTDAPKREWLRQVRRQRHDSETMLGTLMASIAMLFIAAIAGAFIYGSDRTGVQTAFSSAARHTSANEPTYVSTASPSETTGSGQANVDSAKMPGGEAGKLSRTPPAQDPREDEQLER